MTEKVRAAPYGRISDDSTGEELGVGRQFDMARDLITSRGWVEVGAFSDNSISALTGKHRPGYTALCEAIARGEVDQVVCYHLSRLWRNRAERAAGIELFREHRVSITAVRGPDLDMSTAYGRSMAGLLGEFDTMESEVKSERVRDHARQYAESGKFHGGGVRRFGYLLEYDRPATDENGRKQKRRVTAVRAHPDEAPIVVEAARRVLAGESLRAVGFDLAERGVTTSTGRPMSSRNLRLILGSALISGRRELISVDSHKGRARPIMGEIVADGDWPALISVEDSDRLRRLLSDPTRNTNTRPTARKTLLTGILTCGLCRRPMVSRPRGKTPRYVCNRDNGGCGKITTDRTRTDEWVRGRVIAFLAEPPDGLATRLRDRPESDDMADVERAISEDWRRVDDLVKERDDPDMGVSDAEYVRRRKEIIARIRANEALRNATAAPEVNALRVFVTGETGRYLTAAEMRHRWDGMTDAQRRPVVSAAVEKIIVNEPSVRNRFDPWRFGVRWIDEP